MSKKNYIVLWYTYFKYISNWRIAMLIKCPECNRKVSSNADNCPYCGYSIRGSNAAKNSQYMLLFKIVLISVAFLVFIFSGDSPEELKERHETTNDYENQEISETKKNENDFHHYVAQKEPESAMYKNAKDVFCAELKDDFEEYKGESVKLSVPISDKKSRSIESNAFCELTFSFEDEIPDSASAGDYATIVGIADKIGLFGRIYITNSEIVRTGSGEKEKYEAEKEEYIKKNPVSTDDKEYNPTPEPKVVKVEDSITLYCLDLFENYEKYNGQYVTFSAPVYNAYDNSVELDGDSVGKFDIELLEPRNDLKNGDYITVTGLVDGSFFGSVSIINSNISETGEGAKNKYDEQMKSFSESTGRVLDMEALQEDEYKKLCKEMFLEDLTYSEENLEGEYVKVGICIQENGVMSTEILYDSSWMELIKKYKLDKTYCLCSVFSKETNAYGNTGKMFLLFPTDYGNTSSDFSPGEYITIYGKIIAYNVDYWDGHNSAYFIPRYIERS